MPTGRRDQTGFTYVGLLIAVVFFGLGSVGAARYLAATERSEREAELLFVGHQFRQAIRSYLQSGPNAGHYPANLTDLIQDNRSSTPRRHLRRLFFDPITGTTDWGLVNAPEGGIMGIYSLSGREPKKRANFDIEDAEIAAVIDAQQTSNAANPTNSLLLAPVSSPTQDTSLNIATYSYRDWKFVYRPALTGGAKQPSGGGG